jgi:hypothetical protein
MMGVFHFMSVYAEDCPFDSGLRLLRNEPFYFLSFPFEEYLHNRIQDAGTIRRLGGGWTASALHDEWLMIMHAEGPLFDSGSSPGARCVLLFVFENETLR